MTANRMGLLTAARGCKLARKCKWRAAPLKRMSAMAAKCVRLQPKLRATTAEILPELESMFHG
jgi:hypothetical protein